MILARPLPLAPSAPVISAAKHRNNERETWGPSAPRTLCGMRTLEDPPSAAISGILCSHDDDLGLQRQVDYWWRAGCPLDIQRRRLKTGGSVLPHARRPKLLVSKSRSSCLLELLPAASRDTTKTSDPRPSARGAA